MQTIDLTIKGMDCPDCARTLEAGVRRVPGVSACDVNFGAGQMRVAFAPEQTGQAAIQSRITALGYQVAEPDVQPAQAETAVAAVDARQGPINQVIAFLRFLYENPATRPTLFGTLLLLIGLICGWLGAPELLTAAFHTSALVIAGWPLALGAVRSLVLTRRVTIDLLMTIAAVGALLIGEPAEGAAVVILFAIGEALESFTMQRARDSLNSLARLAPSEATVLVPCMDCAECVGRDGYVSGPCPFCAPHPERRPAAQVQVGDTLLVRPGERVPLDGIVISGVTTLNQQHLTGESAPVVRTPGEEVFAGSVNGEGAIELRVTHLASESLLSRIAALVVEAQSQRAPVERFIDRFAAYYTPAVVVIATLIAVIPTAFLGQPLWDAPDGTHGWLYRALSLLVVACPCALVISVPVSIVSALSAATRAGALVRGGAVLETLRSVRVVAFDKTGTLTRGHPQVTGMHCTNHMALTSECQECDDLLAVASAVESYSAHPLAGAVVRAAQSRQLATRYTAESVVSLPGRGVQGQIGGQAITIGSHSYFDAEHSHGAQICDAVREAEASGQTVMMVCACETGGVRGYITLADQVRMESRSVVESLRESGIDRVVMLTGDNAAVGSTIAQATGLDEARCGLLPADKLDAVRELSTRYGPVVMVGDGANDTPALAASAVGVAMGAAGSDQALATADIALMQDDLTRLPFLLRLSRRVASTINWNIALSLGAKVAFLVLALGGWTSLWLAVAADSGIALLVTLNGMRLLRERPD